MTHALDVLTLSPSEETQARDINLDSFGRPVAEEFVARQKEKTPRNRIESSHGHVKVSNFETELKPRATAASCSFVMTSTAKSTSFVQCCTDFVSEHKKAVVLGTAAVVIAAGGAAYYASTSRRPGTGDGDIEKGGEPRKGKDKKKNKSSKKQKTANNNKDGPLLEERTPKVEEGDGE